MIKIIHAQGTAPIYFMYLEGEKGIEYVDWLKENEEEIIGKEIDKIISFLMKDYRILEDDIEISNYAGHINGIKFRFIDQPKIRGVIYIIFLRNDVKEIYPCYIFRTMIEYRLTSIDSMVEYKRFCMELEEKIKELGLNMNLQSLPLRLYPHTEPIIYTKGKTFGIEEIKNFIDKIKEIGNVYPMSYPAFDVRIARDLIEYLI